jgi:hypothetical protein
VTLPVNKVDKSEPKEEVIASPDISKNGEGSKKTSRTRTSFQLPKVASAMTSISNLEQSMPADAVLAKAGAAEVSQEEFSFCEELADDTVSLLSLVFARF